MGLPRCAACCCCRPRCYCPWQGNGRRVAWSLSIWHLRGGAPHAHACMQMHATSWNQAHAFAGRCDEASRRVEALLATSRLPSLGRQELGLQAAIGPCSAHMGMQTRAGKYTGPSLLQLGKWHVHSQVARQARLNTLRDASRGHQPRKPIASQSVRSLQCNAIRTEACAHLQLHP